MRCALKEVVFLELGLGPIVRVLVFFFFASLGGLIFCGCTT